MKAKLIKLKDSIETSVPEMEKHENHQDHHFQPSDKT